MPDDYDFFEWRRAMGVGWVDPNTVPAEIMYRDLDYISLQNRVANMKGNK